MLTATRGIVTKGKVLAMVFVLVMVVVVLVVGSCSKLKHI